MKKQPKIIVITGAESTGKSTLTEQLSTYFGSPFIPEIAREYVENLNRKYNYTDVETIAKMQIELFNTISKTDSKFIFIDTWLIITKIWFEFVYNKTPGWLIKEIEKTGIDMFLVCDIDLPWEFDPVRENGGENRRILQNKYIENIKFFGYKYNVVSGFGEERFNNALSFIQQLK